MFNTFVIYPPGAGGNHLKNMLCLCQRYANSSELDIKVYDANDRAPGEVWCVGGRNLQDVFFHRMINLPMARWIMTAHFGELVQKKQRFDSVPHRKLILLTMDHEDSRRVLEQRQQRLGQVVHPYWLDEELIWCYKKEMYEKYFDIDAAQCMEIDIDNFWKRDFCDSDNFVRLEEFLGLEIPKDVANTLHQKWLDKNFGAQTEQP